MVNTLTNLYTKIFYYWILSHHSDKYPILVEKDNVIKLIVQRSNIKSEITFRPSNIIELTTIDTNTNKIEFYLHFQMYSFKHATMLFDEMLMNMHNLTKKLA